MPTKPTGAPPSASLHLPTRRELLAGAGLFEGRGVLVLQYGDELRNVLRLADAGFHVTGYRLELVGYYDGEGAAIEPAAASGSSEE